MYIVLSSSRTHTHASLDCRTQYIRESYYLTTSSVCIALSYTADAAEMHCSYACSSRISSFSVETSRVSYRFKSLFIVAVAIFLCVSKVGHLRFTRFLAAISFFISTIEISNVELVCVCVFKSLSFSLAIYFRDVWALDLYFYTVYFLHKKTCAEIYVNYIFASWNNLSLLKFRIAKKYLWKFVLHVKKKKKHSYHNLINWSNLNDHTLHDRIFNNVFWW